MNEVYCPDCRFKQPSEHKFCYRCGRALPVDLVENVPSKLARFFAGVKIDDGDPENAYLRVSCYRKEQTFESAEGSVMIPGRHVRFSIWVKDQAKCVLSIPETEARDLAHFIDEGMQKLERSSSAAQPSQSTGEL